MTVALAVVSAVLALLVVVLAVLLLVRRSDRGTDERIAAAVAEMNDRMESMVRELGQALERAEEESRRSRTLGELAGSIELDQVLERTLEATRVIPGADAALVVLPEAANGRALIATVGLAADEAERQGIVAGPPDGRAARAVAIAYRYTPEELERDGALIHAGLTVPLANGDADVGRLAVFTRDRGRTFGDDAIAELEELAQRAAPAIDNARRFREARQLADLDALTGLHNRRYFHETLAREVARAQRYDRQLALIVFDLDDFKAVNDRIGHLAGDAVLAEAAERIRSVVRSADVACRVGGDEFAVILPESTLVDADQLYRRVQHAVSAQPIGQIGHLQLSAGIAELRAHDDTRSFFQRADDALYRAKEAGKGTIVAANAQ
ncbi:MAG TPA: sensor domain-containing diguanylate cyclase [Gaiellaceae bacterium]|nr:sensor domain-containing diguanylate cyclase [Gaiellaceae bacterium]